MTTGAWIIVASVLLAGTVGAWRAYADGRFRRTTPTAAAEPETEPLLPADQLGERATLLQFSSAFCAPCRAARRVLSDVASVVPGVAHVEVDAEQHLDLVRRVGVLRTPTTLVLDAQGTEISRASGAPAHDQVVAALGRVLT